jgi:hypothetical protein
MAQKTAAGEMKYAQPLLAVRQEAANGQKYYSGKSFKGDYRGLTVSSIGGDEVSPRHIEKETQRVLPPVHGVLVQLLLPGRHVRRERDGRVSP